MIKIPTSGYSYPLGPKIEKPLIPVGYIELKNAVDLLGREMFPDEWTGEERGFFGTGTFGQEFKSKIELETDRAFRDAVLMAQCELECESYGGDPKQRYKLRTTPEKDDEPFMPLGDLPRLTPEAMKEIEQRFVRELEKATAIRDRREKVEDRFRRELLWQGTLRAHCVEWGGRIVEIKPHTWGGPFGKPTFERGWISLPTDAGDEVTRPIFVLETELLSAMSGGLANGEDDLGGTQLEGQGKKLSSPSLNDDDVLNKMEILLKETPSMRSINAASQAIAEEAVGGGTLESKAKRLARKYTRSSRYDPKNSD
jgi:hypothetical protein